MTTVKGAVDTAVLEVLDLRTEVVTQAGAGLAVDGVSFTLGRGETLGVVGESGSGKTMLALSLVGLTPRPAARVVGGSVRFRGRELLILGNRELRQIRGRHISLILQDPQSSLNPAFRVGNQVAEALRAHGQGGSKPQLRQKVADLLDFVRIPHPAERVRDYPHQFSGGMRQRVVGAMALACGPEILIADEPTSSLDVTIQASYLRLLRDIQLETGLSMLFITHDMSIVRRLCQRVAVMYAGQFVEVGPTERVLADPQHPYTRALLESVPDVRSRTEWLATIQGTAPSLIDRPGGCRFADRCPMVFDRCQEDPPTVSLSSEHTAKCWLRA